MTLYTRLLPSWLASDGLRVWEGWEQGSLTIILSCFLFLLLLCFLLTQRPWQGWGLLCQQLAVLGSLPFWQGFLVTALHPPSNFLILHVQLILSQEIQKQIRRTLRWSLLPIYTGLIPVLLVMLSPNSYRNYVLRIVTPHLRNSLTHFLASLLSTVPQLSEVLLPQLLFNWQTPFSPQLSLPFLYCKWSQLLIFFTVIASISWISPLNMPTFNCSSISETLSAPSCL